ncbi:hypothetical protein KEM55_007094, partial [Ascosphaera atra]
QVEAYIAKSRWKSESSPFKTVQFIRSQSTSIGDIMRDLHSKHLFEGDFVAVYGDVIGNVPLEGALREHRERRSANRDAIMTMVLREVGLRHRSRPSSTLPVFCIEPATNRCLQYEEMETKPGRKQSRRLLLDPETFEEHAELDIRYDLLDTSIDICNAEVLGLWADSFDYQTPRKHFLHGVLKDFELNGKTIHAHIVKDTYYTARMQSLAAYESTTKDIVTRYAFPFCPDTKVMPDHTYEYIRPHIYIQSPIRQALTAHVGPGTIIGSECTIGEWAKITNSVIGNNCRIGHNVVLENAYIWHNVTIGNGTVIKRAIVADDAVIGVDCNIQRGALISFKIKMDDGVTVPEGRRLVNCPSKNGAMIATDKTLVGNSGQGHEFSHEHLSGDSSDEESDTSSALGRQTLYFPAPL